MKAGTIEIFLLGLIGGMLLGPLSVPTQAQAQELQPGAAAAPPSPPAESETSTAETGPEASGSAQEETESTDLPEGSVEPGVALVQFTTAVEDREPVDAIAFLENEARSIIFYSDIRGYSGATLLHRWEYQGQVMAEVPFVIGGDRWRVWSSKELLPAWIGDWTVSVVKADGEVIAAESFSYNQGL